MPPTTPPFDTTPIVVFGPSGAGKGTLLQKLFAEFPDRFGYSISHTTRAPRPGETHGKEYNFTSMEKFQEMVGQGAFVEWARYGSNCYGTSVKAVEEVEGRGRCCVLEIEMEGVKQVANHPTFPRPRFVFISPPSPEVLEKRLRSRGTDKEEEVLKRLEQGKKEMEFAKSGGVNPKVVVNDDLERAYKELKEWVVGKES
ncbi:guanylate kinase [Coniosporium apollinis CBS 100218]|uniref:Guanylate kinase n=1 Tax=Coniosporium apollinis (strain CBS 100218) TaxID=1168221 RepID=R7YLR6_CONA1|nr:guanylate kinase [Coniosporium apollinis CBS 100218]EON62754.1 guanylate kinase [Coniosporium apollinis CBS 100218]